MEEVDGSVHKVATMKKFQLLKPSSGDARKPGALAKRLGSCGMAPPPRRAAAACSSAGRVCAAIDDTAGEVEVVRRSFRPHLLRASSD